MNRFWGRNEYGFVPKFSRDDEQILALNYENLCDGDYLNRLFTVDNSPTDKDGATAEPTPTGNNLEHSIYHSDIAEDLILFGNSPEIGRDFYTIRFYRDLQLHLKCQDSISNIVNRQVAVFDHIGRLMVERCTKPRPKIKTRSNLSSLEDSISSKPPSLAASFTGVALTCCLQQFDRSKHSHSVRRRSVEPLIGMVFSICQESLLKHKLPEVSRLSVEHIQRIRTILSAGVTKFLSLGTSASDKLVSFGRFEKDLKLALASFYGLLVLGLHTRDPAELLLAISHLLLIMTKSEELLDSFVRETKLKLCIAPPTQTQKQNEVKVVAPISSKSPVKVKSSEQLRAVNSKIPNKQVPITSSSVGSGNPAKGELKTQLSPEKNPSVSLDSSLNSRIDPSELSFVTPPYNNSSNNGSSSTAVPSGAKSWEKPLVKIGLDKETKGKLPASKGLKGDNRSLQDILDPQAGLNSIVPNTTPIVANHVTITYNNNMNETTPANGHNNNQGHSSNQGNNQSTSQKTAPRSQVGELIAMKKKGSSSQLNPAAPTTQLESISPRVLQAQQHQRSKLEIRRFKESLSNALRIPKSVLKILHDFCVVLTDGVEANEGSGLDVPKPKLSSILPSSLSLEAVSKPQQKSSVWSCGQNSYGELGLNDVNTRKNFCRISGLDNKNIVSIGAGNEHSLFVTRDGKLFTSGYNDNGQCGMGTTQQVRQPTHVSFLDGEDIHQVHVYNGCEHTLVLTKEGKIYSFGYNYRGQLGLGNTNSESTPRPIRALLSRKVVLAACSYHHSLMLCADGSLYSCGRNDSGQLGHGDTVDKKTPQLVLNCPAGLKTISCGQFHTVAGTSAGKVFVCGKNDHGQLGLESSSSVRVFTPVVLAHPEMEPVVQVCCGYYHTLLLSASGIVAGFGRNDYGQLGLGHTQPKVYQASVISGLRGKGAVMLAAGCYHSVVITTNGMLYMFGRNNHGQLASGDVEEKHSPHPVDDFVGQKILSVAAGFYHTIVLTAEAGQGVTTGVNGLSPWEVRTNVLPSDVTTHTIGGVPSSLGTAIQEDVAHLTAGLKLPTGSVSREVPFLLENRGKALCRELLVFLMRHIESLTSGRPTEDKNESSMEREESSEKGLAPLSSLLDVLVAAMKISRGLVVSSCAGSKAQVDSSDALLFLHKLLKIVQITLVRKKLQILESIDASSTTEEEEDRNRHDDLYPLFLSNPNKPVFSSNMIRDIYDQCLHTNVSESAESTGEIHRKIHSAARDLRDSLLEVFSCLCVDGLDLGQTEEILTEIGTCFSVSHEILLASPRVASGLVKVLCQKISPIGSNVPTGTTFGAKELMATHNVMVAQVTTTASLQPHQLSYLRFLTVLCAIYRSNEEVIALCHYSINDALVVFRHMLSVYGQFSRRSLEAKALQQTTLCSPLQDAELRRCVSVLEPSISNFVKCCVPMIFSAAVRRSPPSEVDEGQLFKGSTPDQVLRLGVELIKDVLLDAEAVTDIILTQKPSEEIQGQIRYGTVMPSILPSILIYGISYAKHGCLLLDILPCLRRLIHKLQLVGKAELAFNNNNKTVQVKAPLTGEVVPKVEVNSNSSNSTTTSSSNTVIGPAEDLSQQRKEQQSSWWFRVMKLSVTLAAKMATALVHSTQYPVVGLALQALGGEPLTSRGSEKVRVNMETESSSAIAIKREHSQRVFAAEFDDSVYSEVGDAKFSGLARHDIWTFLSMSESSLKPMLSKNTMESMIVDTLGDIHVSLQASELAASLRENERSQDMMYRMVCPSQQSESAVTLTKIEDVLMESVVHLIGTGSPTTDTAVKATGTRFFKLIARITKHIHSRRSEMVSSGRSWTEVLLTLCNLFRVVSRVVTSSHVGIANGCPLMLPEVSRILETSKNADLSKRGVARRRWRKVLMVVFCVNRWRSHVVLHIQKLPAMVLDFVFNTVSRISSDFLLLPDVATLTERAIRFVRCLFEGNNASRRYVQGLTDIQILLTDMTSVVFKSDILSALIGALKEKYENVIKGDEKSSSNKLSLLVRSGGSVNALCGSASVRAALRKAKRVALNFATDIVYSFHFTNQGSYTQQELVLLTNAIKLFHLLQIEDTGECFSTALPSLQSVDLARLEVLFLSLHEKQKQASLTALEDKSHVSSALATAGGSKKASNTRERNAACRRAANSVLSLLQAVSVSVWKDGSSRNRAQTSIQLLDTFSSLVGQLQESQLVESSGSTGVTTSSIASVVSTAGPGGDDISVRSSAESKDTGSVASAAAGVTSFGALLTGNNKPQKEGGGKRRCQDLITKPMEFCRSVEGFLVQGEKLINSYKGMDFTMATWVLLAKKTSHKYSFLTGKVNHNDAWPIVLLRSDGKLDILYGHNNELERFTTEAVVPHFTWTHLALVVEQKKIKVFINGVLDCQVVTPKGNGRAVLFPLLLGSCPQAVRSRVAYIRDGFDGMLAQYKYYSRALSPIHVKVIFDNGPPETLDQSGRYIYQLLASMKCLLPTVNGDFATASFNETVRVSHLVFVSESQKRTQFAALELITQVLCSDVVRDMTLSSNAVCVDSLSNTPMTVNVMQWEALQEFNDFHQKIVGYFLRLIGCCGAPHFLSGLEESAGGENDPNAEYCQPVSSDLVEFLKYMPNILNPCDLESGSLLFDVAGSNKTSIDKLASKEETRLEICFHVMRCLIKLSEVPTWNAAISSVLSSHLEDCCEAVKTRGEWTAALRVDVVGVVLLLGGGTIGKFLGAHVQNAFSDVVGTVLNLNKTTHFATLLTWNASHSHRQIIRVRLSDIQLPPSSDRLALSTLPVSVTGQLLTLLQELSEFIPLLLSDFLSVLKPDHPFQSETLLRNLRPVEVYLFSQLLTAVVTELSGLSNVQRKGGECNPMIEVSSSYPRLRKVLEQAAVATLQVEEENDEVLSKAIENCPTTAVALNLWQKSGNFVLSQPQKVTKQRVITSEEQRSYLDFVSKHLGIASDSLQRGPFEHLLQQGRLSELVYCLSNNVNTYSTDLSDSTDVTVPTTGTHTVVPGTVEGEYLVSSWPSIQPMQLALILEGTISEQDCGNTLRLLYFLRRCIITNSRRALNDAAVYDIQSFQKEDKFWQITFWQALLQEDAGNALSSWQVQNRSLPSLQSTWDAMCRHLISTDRVDVTQALVVSLRYAALSLLQLNYIKSSDNILEAADLFRRILRTSMSWVERCSDLPGCEELYYQVLKILLPALSFIESAEVELQLMQLCMLVMRKMILRIYEGFSPGNDLMDLVRSNNFTLLRARAQEQIQKHKSHNLGEISAVAFNLTQLVTCMEFIQRHGCHSEVLDIRPDSSSSCRGPAPVCTKNQYNSLVAKISATETPRPKLVSVRSASLDTDLTVCALGATALLDSPDIINDAALPSVLLSPLQRDHVLVEVAIGAGLSSEDCVFETVYCGSSLRFVQSGLVPDCTYFLRCRAYCGSIPMAWSTAVEMHTEGGVLFTFDPMMCGPDILLGEDQLTASYTSDDTWSTVLGSRAFSSGVNHWEIRVNQSSTAYVFVGVATSAADLGSFLGGCEHGWGFIGEQALYHNREKVKVYGEPFSSGDVVGITLDLDAGTLSFSKNSKNLGVAFDKIFGELYPAVAFYNVGQELEILVDGFKSTCPCEPIPISPSRMTLDEISLLNEMILSMYHRRPLSARLLHTLTEHCNQWCTGSYVRCRAVSGKDVFLATDSALLRQFGLAVGERVRTFYGVAEVAGTAFNKIWFRINPAGEVWYFSNKRITEGRTKKLFLRCTYNTASAASLLLANAVVRTAESDGVSAVIEASTGLSVTTYDVTTIQELVHPEKWSQEMDEILIKFLHQRQMDCGMSGMWEVTSEQVMEGFRALQQQLVRVVLSSHDLTHRWGIAGPKRKAVVARLGLLRTFNQMLQVYLPFFISDSCSRAFERNQPTVNDDFSPLVMSLTASEDSSSAPLLIDGDSWDLSKRDVDFWPLISLSWDQDGAVRETAAQELREGPFHAIRRRVFVALKLAHFWEVVRRTTTRPAKTDDDYDYPEDLPHVKINRLKSFRAREASELLKIPGEDLILSSMFCQMWRELQQHTSEKLRISYTHPMDDGQSRTFKVKFEGEGVDDYGGPYREIFQQICAELRSPDPSVSSNGAGGRDQRPSSWVAGESMQSSVLDGGDPSVSVDSNNGGAAISNARCFIPLLIPTPNWAADGDCEERYRYMLHPASSSKLKKELFYFFGQLIGIAVRSKITLDLAFPSYLWKCLVGEKLTERDVGSFDAPAYSFMKQVTVLHQQLERGKKGAPVSLENDSEIPMVGDEKTVSMENTRIQLEELIEDLTWSYRRIDGKIIELVEGGVSKGVKIEELGEFLNLYFSARLMESQKPIAMLRKGLISIIPESSISLLNWEELQSVVCGSRVIDINRLKENTEYDDDISADDAHIMIFWEVLSEFSEEEKSAFLRFVWARPTLPPLGVEFSQKMRILSAVGDDATSHPDTYLPKAHTCFFSINLPKYTNKEVMVEKLKYAIFNCTEMDADFRTTETEIAGWNADTNTVATDPTDWSASLNNRA